MDSGDADIPREHAHYIDQVVSISDQLRAERVPVIVGVARASEYSIVLKKSKFAVPCDMTVGKFMFVLREKYLTNYNSNDAKFPSSKALFIACKEYVVHETVSLKTNKSVLFLRPRPQSFRLLGAGEVFEQLHDTCAPARNLPLFLILMTENTFGNFD